MKVLRATKMKLYLLLLITLAGMVKGNACDTDYFECDNGKCVPSAWVCDGDNDCEDGSDERKENCPPCNDDEFTCDTGRCIPLGWICDGDDDCKDMSDEYDPATGECPKCPDTAFTCPNTGRCICSDFTCDGFDHCGDWSDETEDICPCADDEIRCSQPPGHAAPGPCIPSEWICDEDGIWDCPTGDDEANCTQGIVLDTGTFRKFI